MKLLAITVFAFVLIENVFAQLGHIVRGPLNIHGDNENYLHIVGGQNDDVYGTPVQVDGYYDHNNGLGAIVRHPLDGYDDRNYYHIIPNGKFHHLYRTGGRIRRYRLRHTLPLTGHHDPWSRGYLRNNIPDGHALHDGRRHEYETRGVVSPDPIVDQEARGYLPNNIPDGQVLRDGRRHEYETRELVSPDPIVEQE